MNERPAIRHGASERAEAFAFAFAGWIFFVSWSLLLGKDISFDSLNYHFYLADSVDASRIHKDFFGANLQGYQIPYAYWPLAWMAHGKWPTWLALLLISTVQALCVPALWMTARAVFTRETRHALVLRLVAVTLGVASPVLLSQIGGTFIDLATGTALLYSVALLLWGQQGYIPRRSATLAAGALAGLAVALKLTNAPVAVCLPMIFLLRSERASRKLAELVVFGAAMAGVCLLVMGHWSWNLWLEHSNPFFPFANEWFKSLDFPTQSMKVLRFVPRDWVEAVARPFAMVEPFSQIYHEIASPDARFIWITVGCASGLLAIALGALQGRGKSTSHDTRSCSIPLCAFVAVAWVVWLSWSGNGRYFVSVLALAGVCVTAIFADPVQPRWLTHFGLLSLLLVQGTLLSTAATFRWTDDSRSSLSSPFIEITVPDELRDRPLTFLTIGKQSMAFLELGAHEDSTWMNVAGMHAIDPRGVNSLKALAKLRDRRRHIVVVTREMTVESDKAIRVMPSLGTRTVVGGLLAPFGVELDEEKCIVGDLPRGRGNVKVTNPNNESVVARLLYCPAHFSEELRTRTLEAREMDPRIRRIDSAFDELEVQCPKIFGPPGAVPTLAGGLQLARSYLMTDATLMADENDTLSYSAFGSAKVQMLGSPEDVFAGRAKAACARLPKFYSFPWDRD